MLPDGNIVKEFTLPNGAGIKICDDDCRGKTSEESQAIIDEIGRMAYPILRNMHEAQQSKDSVG